MRICIFIEVLMYQKYSNLIGIIGIKTVHKIRKLPIYCVNFPVRISINTNITISLDMDGQQKQKIAYISELIKLIVNIGS